jgi:hypothetical protein
MTLLPFLRSGLGEAVVTPAKIIIMAALLVIVAPCVVAVWCGMASWPVPNFWPLVLFGMAYFATASAVWWKRYHGLRQGEDIHSYDYGVSRVAGRLPYSEPVSEIIVIPVAVMSTGYFATYTFLASLGYWLIIAGVSLFILARWEYRLDRARYRTMVDDMIHARTVDANARMYEQRGFSHRDQGNPSQTGDDADDFTADLRQRRR